MRALRWLFDSYRRLNLRERQVVLGGALVSAAALIIVVVVLPFAHRWMAREAVLSSSREQWARLQALVANEGRLRQALDEQRLVRQSETTRLVTGATAALAASALQEVIQRYAQESSVQLDRMDVVGEPNPDRPGLTAIPVQLQGQGDIYGLVDLLYRLKRGDKLLVLDEMTVNAGLQGTNTVQYLSWSMRLHGLYPSGPGGS